MEQSELRLGDCGSGQHPQGGMRIKSPQPKRGRKKKKNHRKFPLAMEKERKGPEGGL